MFYGRRGGKSDIVAIVSFVVAIVGVVVVVVIVGGYDTVVVGSSSVATDSVRAMQSRQPAPVD